jgi:hypothetical protein
LARGGKAVKVADAERGEMASPVFRHQGGSMKKFVLVISITLVLASSVYAQTDGQYMGRTSQNMNFQFVVTGGGTCVDQLSYGVTLGCPSGAMTGWGAGFGGCQTIQPDGTFMWVVPAVEAGIVTYVVSGSFVAPDAAEGTINFRASHLRVDGPDVSAQLCDSSIPDQVIWRATHTAGPAEPLKFDGNQVVTSVNQNTGDTSSSVKPDSK